MTTETQTPASYVDTVAPYPLREEDVTAAVMARHLACQVQQDITRSFRHYYLSGPVGDKQGARDYGLLISRMAGYYGALRVLRVLIEHAPDKADEVARQLWCDWNACEPVGECTWEWLIEYGIDPDRISAEVEPMARIEQPSEGSGPLVDRNPETHAGYPGSGLARCGAPIGAHTVAPGEEFTCRKCQATHDADLHGGDREVPDWMLIERGSAS